MLEIVVEMETVLETGIQNQRWRCVRYENRDRDGDSASDEV